MTVGRAQRTYATNAEDSSSSRPPNERPPWIEVLEEVSNGPWLTNTTSDEKVRLAIAHGLVYQLLLYLSRPIESAAGADEQSVADAHAQYLSAFAVASVPPTSEMARARIATAKLVKAVLNQHDSIPPTSPLRADAENKKIFEAFQALKDMGDAHLTNNEGAVEDWKEFWGHSQPVVVALVEALGERGFVLSQEGEE
ncbi:hypothetical protein DFP72DRAFT_847439 [Ephemerocybe angulata]|uniref:Uncharacterized protein n=1 Tax=Ephemerocybe angulata TaxID=980116 RepID=A0A8H6HZC6_9AGAR|nr:hypothetical protein DFP72DRAFT_847439 [Tulosesus angulatus]